MGKLIQGVNDLATLYPDIAAEWHPTKNGDLTPRDVVKATDKKIWWLGRDCGHEWQALIASRTLKGTGCPYCAGKKVLSGFNDLETLYPDVAAEWHPTLNGELTPREVSGKSHKRAFWICEHGHVWDAVISNRTLQGTGCPYCSGRKAWSGFNDLATLYPDVATEWHPTKNDGVEPTDITAKSGMRVTWICSQYGHEWETRVCDRISYGTGCPICAGQKVLEGFNDLLSQHPGLASEWHPTKNDRDPNEVTCGSGYRATWRCVYGHEWKTAVSERVNRGTGCPVCDGKQVIAGFNDLKSQCPDLVAEWDTEHNTLMPDEVTCGSHKRAWWRCAEGHVWEAEIKSRFLGAGCPFCSGRNVIEGESDLATVSPEIAAEWHPSNNGTLSPCDVKVGSDRKIWWLCPNCNHEWMATVRNRTANGSRCPRCASSLGESTVANVLENLNIAFVQERKIDGCRDKGHLRHDFILLDGDRIAATIEYNGIQHYEPTAFSSSMDADTALFDVRRRDIIKTRWLTSHGIPQLVISYEDYDDIASIIEDFLYGESAKQSLVVYSLPLFISQSHPEDEED